jgi:ribosome-associated translation inhibitor RaiA
VDHPVQVTFHGISNSAALAETILERATHLERYHPHVIRCRAVVEKAEHHNQGFTVKLEIQVEGHEIVVSHEHGTDPLVAVRAAFEAARRRLEDDAKRRGAAGRRSLRRHQRQIPPAG